MSARAVPASHEGHPAKREPVLTDPPWEIHCVLLRHSLDSPLGASVPGRVPPGGLAAKRTGCASQCEGPAPGGRSAAARQEHAHSAGAGTHARTRTAGWTPSPPNPLREGRLVLLAKSGVGRRGGGGAGSEVGWRTEWLHPCAHPGGWKGSGCGWVGAFSSVPVASGEGAPNEWPRHSQARLREAGRAAGYGGRAT